MKRFFAFAALIPLLSAVACGDDSAPPPEAGPPSAGAVTDAPPPPEAVTPTAGAVTPAVPIPDQNPIPYPSALYTDRVEGEVMLYLYVDATGAVIHDSTRIVQSSGHSEFDAAALQAAPTLRFVPAHVGDSAVAAPIQVPIRFSLPDSLGRTAAP
jgi:protein TonB